MSNFSIDNLKVNYRRNPLGIDDPRPRLSWQIISSSRGFIQQAYQIQVATDDAFLAGRTWDTGQVQSGENVHIEYSGEPLASRTRYYFRVRIWDKHGAVSEWSETAYWETAFLSQAEWRARWISAPIELREKDVEACDYVRTTFMLDKPIRSARVYATALGLYRLYINGKPADDTLFNPGWTSYNKRLQYQTYDVSDQLVHGQNAIGCILGNGWYSGYLAWENDKELYGSVRALLLQMRISYEDGTEQIITTDDSWKAGHGPLQMSELYHGERYDARIAIEDWSTAAFHDGSWLQVSQLEAPQTALVAQQNEQVSIIEEIKPIAIMSTPKQETVIDFGQNMVGWVRFSVQAQAGDVITIEHAEVLDKEGNFYTGNLRSAKQCITYICKGDGVETYEPIHSFQGFRYIRVSGAEQIWNLEQFTGCVIHTALEATGNFECSDELVNQLQRNIVWGQRGNFLDVPTDCPQRDERLGWTGDAQVFIRTAAFNMNVVPFFEKWLADLALDQESNGRVPHVIPDVPNAGYGSSAWGDAAVICPWTLYQCYGDIRVLQQQYPSMKAWVEYIRGEGEDEYLWNTGFHFGDWLGLDAKENSYVGATPRELIATAFYAYSTSLLAQAAAVIGILDEAREYEELHRNIVAAFREEFVTPRGRVASPTQTAYLLALMFDLLEEKDRKRTAHMLAEHIKENGIHLTAGFVGTPYLCLVLSRYGYTDLAYQLVLQKEYPSWLYSVMQGATTIWEHWDGIKPDGSFWSDAMNSYNHYAYGAVGDWLYRVAGGIDLLEPGYKKVKIAPQFGQYFTWVNTGLTAVYGDIHVHWRKEENNSVKLEVTIPANTTAEIVFPVKQAIAISENGMSLGEMEGLINVKEVKQGQVVSVGSGNYCFTFIHDLVDKEHV